MFLNVANVLHHICNARPVHIPNLNHASPPKGILELRNVFFGRSRHLENGRHSES